MPVEPGFLATIPLARFRDDPNMEHPVPIVSVPAGDMRPGLVMRDT
jgi:hypothetical protein